MRDLEVGRIARALRRRRRWRQQDVALRAGLHRSTVSLIERGRLSGLTLRVIRQHLDALGAQVDVAARWRGAELDRLLDEQHSWLQAAWKARLERWGWDVAVEASFNRYGERGRIDLLAWRAAQRILLVIEVKTEVLDAQGLLGGLDVKTRLGPFVGRDLGWARPALLAPALIITDGSTNRDRISRLAPLFGRFRLRGRAAISWLRRPEGVVTGLLLFSDLRPATTNRVTRLGRQRIR
jgi:transcriptional regulator with XRE-family HTH domain